MSGKVIVIALIVLVAAVCTFRFWPSDQRAIRKQLAVIEEAGSKEPAETSIESLFKAKQIAELFSDPCRLTVASANHVGEYPRKQIQERVVMVRGFYTQASVALHDMTIDISETNTAVVRGTLRLRGKGRGEAIADVHELRAEMGKIDGKWLLTAVEIVEVLER